MACRVLAGNAFFNMSNHCVNARTSVTSRAVSSGPVGAISVGRFAVIENELFKPAPPTV